MKSGSKYFFGNKKFENLNNQLIIKYDSFTVDAVWRKIGARYDGLVYKWGQRFSEIKKSSVDFLPLAAAYLTLKNEDPSDALTLIKEQLEANKFQAVREEREKDAKRPKLIKKIFSFSPKKVRSQQELSLISDFCKQNECLELEQVLTDFL